MILARRYTRNLKNTMVDNLKVERFVVDNFLSNAYLIISDNSIKERRAIVIDPNISEQLVDRIKHFGVSSLLIILTHEHFDHTTGVNGLQNIFDCEVLCQKYCAEKVATKRNNRPLSIMSGTSDARHYLYYEPYEISTEITFDKELLYEWCGHKLHLVHTPGHAKGACCIEIDGMVFVGDNMLLDKPVITRFPGGSQEEYEQITLPYLRTISKDEMVFPGHYEPFSMAHTKESNGFFISE